MRSQFFFCCLLTSLMPQASEVNDSTPSTPTWQPPPDKELTKHPPFFTSENHGRILDTVSPKWCPPGQYGIDSSTCGSCDSSCAYCEDLTKKCLGCVDPNKMEIDTNDITKCKCKGDQTGTTNCACSTNNWFDGTNCHACTQGEYYYGNSCTSCLTTKKFRIKHSLSQKQLPSCCGDNKYYNFDKNCQPCSSTCLVCEESTGTCLKEKCKKNISAINVQVKIKKNSCCPDGQYNVGTNGKSCRDCQDTNCNICSDDTGSGSTCLQCKKILMGKNVPISIKKTSCCGNIEEFKPNDGSACKACIDENCKVCEDGDGQTCIKCKDRVKMRNITVKVKKTSCCAADHQYYKDGSCKDCDINCSMCKDDTGECFNCIKKIKASAVVVDFKPCCNAKNYWKVTGSTKACTACPDSNCDECQNGTGNCLKCSKNVHMKPFVAGIKKQPSCCGNNQYFETGTTCKPCKENCLACKDGDGSCIKCNEKTMKFPKSVVKLKKTSCCALDNQYYKNGSCQNCIPNCLICKDVSGDCISCSKKIKATGAVADFKTCCPTKNYWKVTGSTKACTPCPDKNCDQCQNATGKCLNCSKNVKLKVVAGVKKQPSCCNNQNEYRASDNTCKTCPTNCSICKDGNGDCLICTDSKITKFRLKAVKLKKTSCCIDDNKYWSSNNKCELCPGSHCVMCGDVSGDCIKCEKYIKASGYKASIKKCCGNGNYYSIKTKDCAACPVANCGLCENISGKCIECDKNIKMKAVASFKPQPSCCKVTSQYFDNTDHKCKDCSSNCNVCQDGSGACLNCNTITKFKAKASAKKTSCCPANTFWNQDTKKCESCDSSCLYCEDGSGTCNCNKKIPFKAIASSKVTSCCDYGKYWDNTSCKTCKDKCFECEDETGDCIRCDEEFVVVTTVYSSAGSCCPDGFYYENGKCNACTKPCATCTSATKCTSCTAMATYDKAKNSCTCKTGYYNSANDCAACKAPCSACSSESICSSCRAHATFDPSSKQCNCDSNFSLNSTDIYGYCTANCNNLCTECNIDDGNKCSKCITNAELSGNKCSCTANSVYDASSKSCVCNNGYILAYNKCINCKKYLSPSDVKSAEFSSTWTSININFNVKIEAKLSPACAKIFSPATLALLGTGPICSWIDQKTLKVVFGSLFTLRNQTMSLEGTYLVKDTTDACTLTYQPLSIVPTGSTSPSPSAVLSGPSSASLSCGASEPLKYSGEKSTMSIGAMSYAWSSTISLINSQLSEFIKNTKTGSLSIPRSLFDISVTTTLNVTLEVTNYFGIKDKTWMVTTVTGESSLTVIFDQGTSISMKASSSTTIKAKINSLCANSTSSTFSWAWKYYSGPKIDSASIIQNAKNDKLTINKNALVATTDTPYVFMAIATQNYNGATVSGNSTISITVTSSPLSIQLSKTSSDVSPDSDYTVDASGSKDPDDPTGNLTYHWTCLNSADATTCIGNDGKTLLDNEKSANLKIPSSRLVKGAQWDITCTISKDVRTASATITLKVLNTISTSKAEIVLKATKFNPQGTNQFSASVTSDYSPTLLWTCTSGQDITISPNYLSTISLPAGTLTEGNSYTFTLAISAQDQTFSVSLPISSNLGASCTGSAGSDPTTGNALTTSFKLSIDGCYDKDEEDYPLTYRYLDVTGGKTYTLGYTTEINYLSTYLFPNKNDITIRVCDSLVTCSDYSLVLVISPAQSRMLASSSLMDAYIENTIDIDNIPATISLFCGSATIDSELFAKMWSDLQSYVANNEVTNDLLQNALGAAYSMTTQTEQMSAQMFTTMADWLAGVIYNNPSLVPSQENMVTVVSLVDNYLSYGYLTDYVGMTLENYILNADKFLTQWEIAATLDDLVTQSAMDGSQNTDMTKVFKYRDFPTSMVNRTVKIGENQTISIPTHLSYADTDVMNVKLHYYNISEEFSDITMISFANSGNYINYTLETSTETYMPFSTDNHPFVLELPINRDLGHHYSWGCLYYNEVNSTWEENGCQIIEIKNNSIIFEVYHFSMFKLTQTPIYIPSKPSDTSCESNFAPLYILVITLFLSIVLASILTIIDNKHSNQKVHPVMHDIELYPSSPAVFLNKAEADVETIGKNEDKAKDSNNPSRSLVVESLGNEEYEVPNFSSAFVEKEKDGNTPKTPNEIKGASTKIVLTEFHSSDLALPKSQPEEEVTKIEPVETELQSLLEGHLLFGLLYFRHSFSRAIRVFIFVAVIIFELLLEGLLIYGFEDISKGISASTETLFNDYDAVYFGYTILALVIAMPIELFMISSFAVDRNKAPLWRTSALVLGIMVLIGSIIGIVLLNIEFCFEWSGYWAISFLYGILVQTFLVDTLYMIGRYVAIQFFS